MNAEVILGKALYKAPIPFVIDNRIREFDISKANINILRDLNILTEDTYQYLLQAPKQVRVVYIGKLIGSNSDIGEFLKAGIKEARFKFVQQNNIPITSILAVRNDAITVIGNTPISNLDITSRVRFRLVGEYTSFYALNNLDFLYYYNQVENRENLDIKGLSDGAVDLHRSYMLDFLMELFYTIQIEGLKQGISLLSSFYKSYIDRVLDINYYRELNSQSKFLLISEMSMVVRYLIDDAMKSDMKYIDISHNEMLLRKLNSMLASLYFSQR